MEEFVNDFCRTIYEIIRIEDEEEGEGNNKKNNSDNNFILYKFSAIGVWFIPVLYEIGGEEMDSKNKPNGLSWFALGFSIASLIAVLIK